MNPKYKEFLDTFSVISEEEFMEVINSFPEFDISFLNNDYIDTNIDTSQDELAANIIQIFLEDNSDCAFCDEAFFDSKQCTIIDVYSKDELGTIKNILGSFDWKIENESGIIELLEEEEDVIYSIRTLICNNNSNLEELKKWVEEKSSNKQ